METKENSSVKEIYIVGNICLSIQNGEETLFTPIYFCINSKVYIDMFSNKVSISNQQTWENWLDKKKLYRKAPIL